MDLYGGVYGLPCGTGDKGGFVAVPDFRWDVYKEVGYPEINTMDDLLETLKQMQDACPETEDGSKVYGIGLFSNWDGATPYLCHEMYYGLLGYRTIYSVCTVPVDLSSDVEYMLEDDSQLYNALKYFYKANQMGILDPDSPANTYDAYAAKASAGGYLMPVWNWHRNLNSSTEENIEKGIGFQSLLANAFTLSKAAYAPMGNGWRMCVSANSDHLDAALAFLNYVYSFEGQEEISNGVEGVLYEYDENGTRVMTEDYKAVRNAGGDRKELVTVENYWDQTLFMGGFHGLIYPSTINTNTGAPIGIDEQYPMYGTTALEEDWYSVYGQVTVNEYSMKGDEAEFASIVEVSPAFSFLPTMSEEMSELYSGFKSVMNTACWKMIFAADEAEFEALWTQLQKDAESVGLEQIAVAAQEALDQAVSSIDKYTK